MKNNKLDFLITINEICKEKAEAGKDQNVRIWEYRDKGHLIKKEEWESLCKDLGKEDLVDVIGVFQSTRMVMINENGREYIYEKTNFKD